MGRVAKQSLEQWQVLIDWAGRLCAAGATLTVRDGALYAQGPPALLTPPVLAALRRHEPVLFWLLLRAETAAVAWRVAAMLGLLSRRPGSWRNLKARPARRSLPGTCRSCGEPLRPGAAGGARCPDCARAVQLVLRRVREADLG